MINQSSPQSLVITIENTSAYMPLSSSLYPIMPGADPGGGEPLGAEAPPLHIQALLDQYAEYKNEILS